MYNPKNTPYLKTNFVIEVFSTNLLHKQCINFFESNEWNEANEKLFLLKMKELFELSRAHCTNIDFQIKIESHDVSQLAFVLNKYKTVAKPASINTSKLTIRELEIVGLIMQGMTNKEIAQKLFISYETAKSHRKNILEKTGSKNSACLANYYHQTFFEK
jgi:DNA-binding CsgD family transcriptional regulator